MLNHFSISSYEYVFYNWILKGHLDKDYAVYPACPSANIPALSQPSINL